MQREKLIPLPVGKPPTIGANGPVQYKVKATLPQPESDNRPVPEHPSGNRFTGETEQFQKGANSSRRTLECPLSVMADSYKGTHLLMYPDAQEMRVYGTFRKQYPGMGDHRIVVYGIKYYISQFISRYISEQDVEAGRAFMKVHLKNYKTNEPTPIIENESANGDYFELLLKNHSFPVKIEALPEGSVIRPNIPAYIITATDENSRLCAFLETILTMIWYPSTVATLSKHTKNLISKAFKRSVDLEPGMYKTILDSRLHDFGFRGCTCVEQSVIGGSAHLLSFNGSDTMSACYHVTYHLNKGIPIGISIPATEHSVMTSWSDEVTAINNLCDKFPREMVACVMDSYDYDNALAFILPKVRDKIVRNECRFIIRPDSGDAVEQVMKGLRAAEKVFESKENTKGFRVINHCSVIQGDGINYDTIKIILEAVLAAGFSAENVAFGMGGGLLQKVDRDTMSFATKLSYTRDKLGNEIESMKCPEGIPDKWSLPGKVLVLQEILDTEDPPKLGPHVVYTEEDGLLLLEKKTHKNSMRVVYDGSGTADPAAIALAKKDAAEFYAETFDQVRERLEREWEANTPGPDTINEGLRKKQLKVKESHSERIRKMQDEIPPAKLNSRYTMRVPRLQAAGNDILRVLNKTLQYDNMYHD